jgi:hypothetical protein
MADRKWQCRIAPSLGDGFDGTPHECWGTNEYFNNVDPTVFFGLYGFKDFISLWEHKGKKAILWAGSDIQYFLNGYWLDKEGKMRLRPFDLAPWIDTYCDNYVENEKEQSALRSVGIRSKVIPSFLGDVSQYKVNFVPGNKLYTSVSSNNFKLYGWDKIPQLAEDNPDIEFHLYGNTISPGNFKCSNIIVHGRVSQEQMNMEIKNMQGALRLNESDGFSEIIAKSVLMAQWPVSLIEYPYMLKLSEIRQILEKKEPNIKGRKHYLNIINQYPWKTK